ncbi:alpha/beta hydrolase [Candidatus Acetothermia bacterium]|nr:alpha/beta hydrolase [Candidatus Acetothermia bacterium]MBI3643478.1 alpha/beta hydrolase [Candidatus Acetothermia bacterium]
MRIFLSLGLTALLFALITLSETRLNAQDQTQYSVDWLPNIIYYQGPGYDDVEHRLDLYRPIGLEKAPVLLFIHGGSWREGDKSIYTYLGRTFASQGFLTVIANYRLTPQVQHPVHVQDVARAFSWIYANISQYSGDPNKIFMMGHSAGGHLVALLALDERYLQAEGLATTLIRGVIPVSGVFDLTQFPPTLFADVFTSDPDTRKDASPISHVDDQQPPFQIIYAQYDEPTLDTQAQALYQSVHDHGSQAHIAEIPNKDHITIIGHIGLDGDPTTAAIVKFIRDQLSASE